ncbi:hypothetical protein AAAC12_35675 [Pseudomonas aeruginosa]|uniref:hypothetical protein n=1 Tax=Pseudomonas aeruginosa TaxID=287 RepID=UPI0030F21886
MLRRTPAAEIPDFDVDDDLVISSQPTKPAAAESKPVATVESSPAASVSPAPKENLIRLARHEGILLEHGAANYNFDKTESMSYYAKLQVGQDARYVSGRRFGTRAGGLGAGNRHPGRAAMPWQERRARTGEAIRCRGQLHWHEEETVNRNTWSVTEALRPELTKVAEAGGEMAGQAMVQGVDLDAAELSVTRLQVQGLDAAPGLNLTHGRKRRSVSASSPRSFGLTANRSTWLPRKRVDCAPTSRSPKRR